jgi:hypothetical protein
MFCLTRSTLRLRAPEVPTGAARKGPFLAPGDLLEPTGRHSPKPAQIGLSRLGVFPTRFCSQPPTRPWGLQRCSRSPRIVPPVPAFYIRPKSVDGPGRPRRRPRSRPPRPRHRPAPPLARGGELSGLLIRKTCASCGWMEQSSSSSLPMSGFAEDPRAILDEGRTTFPLARDPRSVHMALVQRCIRPIHLSLPGLSRQSRISGCPDQVRT